MIVLQGMAWCILDLCKEVRVALHKYHTYIYWDCMEKQAMIVLQGMAWCILDLCKEVCVALPKYHTKTTTILITLFSLVAFSICPLRIFTDLSGWYFFVVEALIFLSLHFLLPVHHFFHLRCLSLKCYLP